MNCYPESHKVKKRTPNACQRCRRHKIKCSGSPPCSNCSRSGKPCVFNAAEPSISISKRYLADLEERLAILEEGPDRANDEPHVIDSVKPASLRCSPEGVENESDRSRRHEMPNATQSLPVSSHDHAPNQIVPNPRSSYSTKEQRRHSLDEEAELINPLSAGPSDTGFISNITSGSPVYLGTSSNWSFSRRALDRAHKAVHNAPLTSVDLALDGDVYNLAWDGSRQISNEDKIALPTLNHSRYLVRSVQFHIGEIYHLFDEATFMSELDQFHQDGPGDAHKRKLWYVHYLLVMALGKACISRRPGKGTPPGAELFVQAMKILPDVSQLWSDPFTTTEIFCCAALYLQGADYRYGAYIMIGSAIRTALFQGMHTDMPLETFGTSQIERARRIWWTVYVLDRELSSLMGLPVQLSDDVITTKLPAFNSSQQAAALGLYIKLCRLNAQVVSTVYGPEARLDKRFLISTKLALTQTAAIAETLSKCFKLVLDDPGENISRLAATLHLQHHQCIVLTTRPLLFSLFKRRMDDPDKSPSMISSMQRLKVLLQMCIDSSRHSLSILSALQVQDFLATFVPFDLEATFSSAIIVLMASIVEPVLVDDVTAQMTMAYSILEDFSIKGNLIASRRKSELQQLEALLDAFKARERGPRQGAQSARLTNMIDPDLSANLHPTVGGDATAQPGHDTAWISNQLFDDWTWEAALDADQLMNVADLLDTDQMTAFSGDFNF